MPIWSEILAELSATAQARGGLADYDGVRRKYLHLLREHTGRDVVLYGSGWLQKPQLPPESVSITDEDVHALMEVSSGLQGPALDLILHSPGGSLDAAEAIVSYVRSRFSHVRVIVPQLAMSAATMICCSADEIVMGKHSSLGPTDPQLLLATPLGVRLVPAQAILDQFTRAQEESSDPAKLPAWLPMLGQFGPDLLRQSENLLELSKDLVGNWLQTYMFALEADGANKAEAIASWLGDHGNFKSHSRHLPRRALSEQGLKVVPLEADSTLQDLSLSVFHATTQTLSGTPSVKIVENHLGRAYVKQHSPPPPPPQLDLTLSSPPNVE